MSFKIPEKILRTIFRANDIRGNVENELTPDVVYAIGLALAKDMIESSQEKIIIARDGRLSGPVLAQALVQGLRESGLQIIDIGAMPTPILYFATHVLETTSGIMITGSHNPAADNGLKIIMAGEILSEEHILSILDKIKKKQFIYGNGKIERFEILPKYYSEIIKNIEIKRQLRIVVDCGNGIVGKVFPDLARKLGLDVIELFCDVDGNFPNHFPDPSVLKNMEFLTKSVIKNQADLGVAFDGDGDRLGMVTNKGQIICADRLLMLFAEQILRDNAGAKIIYDVKCTRLLDKWIKEHNGNPLMWKTGHSLIMAKIKETNASLAGEMSGHFYFNDRFYGFDDALYAAVRLIEILSEKNESLDQIFSHLPDSINTPEIRIPMADEEKFEFMKEFEKGATFKDAKIITIDGIRAEFDFGFGLIRASNTTPCLILRFEADTEINLKLIEKLFKAQLLALRPKLQIPF